MLNKVLAALKDNNCKVKHDHINTFMESLTIRASNFAYCINASHFVAVNIEYKVTKFNISSVEVIGDNNDKLRFYTENKLFFTINLADIIKNPVH